MSQKLIAIDVIADIVCPWCFLGRKRLEKAIALLPEIDIRVSWKPFQLSPEIPSAGKPYQDHMRSVLGSRDAVDESERTLIALGEEDGIAFDFNAISRMPNTLDAHRVIYWASQDKEGVQDRLVGELFSRYFEQGQDIGKPEVLIEAASTSGMQGNVVGKLLTTDIDRNTIIEDIVGAQYIGVRGVPSFIVDKKFVVMGAQPVDILADAIQQTADGFEPGAAEDR